MQISRENLEIASKLARCSEAPEGWKRLGCGSSRVAFLAPDGLVYKVCQYGDEYQSRVEGRVVWTMRKSLPAGVIIPRAHFDEESRVLVMEYFEGTQPQCSKYGCRCGRSVCWYQRLRALGEDLRLCDVQTDNAVLMADDTIVIIDLGCEA